MAHGLARVAKVITRLTQHPSACLITPVRSFFSNLQSAKQAPFTIALLRFARKDGCHSATLDKALQHYWIAVLKN